jgi:hypothetical protein
LRFTTNKTNKEYAIIKVICARNQRQHCCNFGFRCLHLPQYFTSTSAPTTATENTTAPTASAPATTTVQTPQNEDIDDIADRVEEALDSDATLKQFDLDADDQDNSIVLTGRVQTAEQKALAEQIARQNAPNISLNNQIVLQ